MKYPKPEKIYKERAAETDFCSFGAMPAHLVRILILIEDFSFYRHHGIQPKAIMEALRSGNAQWFDMWTKQK